MLLRRIARPMLAGIFVQGGVNTLRQLDSHVARARPVVEPVAEKAPDVVPGLASRIDPVTLVKLDAAVKIGAGTLLALGKAPRLVSVALAASLVPTTLAGHAFWNEADESARAQQRIQFFKNLGLLGGLMIASADTAGKPSLAWRGKRAARLGAAEVERMAAGLGGAADSVGGRVSGRTAELAGKAGGTASALAGVAAGGVSALATRASAAGSQLTREAERKAAKLQRRATKQADKLRNTAAKRAAKLSDQAATFTELAAARADSLGKSAAGWRAEAADRAASLGDAVSDAVSEATKDATGRVRALAR